MLDFKDKVAIVTGAARGIGEATAWAFANRGAIAVIVDINGEGAEKVVSDIKGKGLNAIAYTVDVSDVKAVDAMVEDVFKKYGRIDVLVNNAYISGGYALVTETTQETWDSVITVNLTGAFNFARACAKKMVPAKYGKIVNTASIGALGNVGQANYSASKAGVMGLTRTLALEFARYNIAVNCVSPGATETQMTAGIPEDIRKFIEGKIPFRRFAKPEEIAQAHAFLASDHASYITGQTLFVDGGISVGI